MIKKKKKKEEGDEERNLGLDFGLLTWDLIYNT